MAENIIKNIKSSINESEKKIFWFDNAQIPKLLVSGLSKTETKKKVERLKLKEGTKLIRLSIEFHSGKKPEHPAKICIVSKTHIIENKMVKFDNTWQKYSNGYIWFDDDFLERRKWKDYYVSNIVKKVNAGHIKFKFGIIYYKQIE